MSERNMFSQNSRKEWFFKIGTIFYRNVVTGGNE
jgi:hypothetical protein